MRYYGDKVFEGNEVTDEAYETLTALRQQEGQEIDDAEDEMERWIRAVEKWRDVRIAELEDEIRSTEREAEQEIWDIISWSDARIAELENEIQVTESSQLTREEKAAIIAELTYEIQATENNVQREIRDVMRWRDARIAELENEIRATDYETEEEIEYAREWCRRQIEEIRERVQAEINGICAEQRTVPVYQVRGQPNACTLCMGKIGEVGTMEMLEERDCVPTFHEHCKCSEEEVGYTIERW